METTYNTIQNEWNVSLFNDPKDKYNPTPEDDSLLPDSFSKIEKRIFKKYCHKLKYENGVIGFFNGVDENYSHNSQQIEFNPKETVLYRYNEFRDKVLLKEKGIPSMPYSREDLMHNLSSFWHKIKRLFIDSINLHFFPYLLFKKAIIHRVNSQLDTASGSHKRLEIHLEKIRKEIKKSTNIHNEALLREIESIYIDAITRNDSSFTQKPNILVNNENTLAFEYEKAETNINIYFDGSADIALAGKASKKDSIIGIEFCRNVYNEIYNSEYFIATEEEFVNAFNLIGKPKSVKVIEDAYFFYLARKFVDVVVKERGRDFGTK